jgi:hypothetical protein
MVKSLPSKRRGRYGVRHPRNVKTVIVFAGRREDSMREIRFRAWDIEEGCWIPESFMMLNPRGKLWTIQELGQCPIEETIPYVIQQYTGLKDKNGKEIYEGDVLQYVGRRRGTNSPKIVNWMTHKKGTFTGFQVARGENYEIIGNIYENPELIGG